MFKINFFLILFLLILANVFSQDCSKIKIGVFYFYPPKSDRSTLNDDYFLIERNDSIQKEINHKTHDTSYWRINMAGSCIFKLNCFKLSRNTSDDEMRFIKAQTTVIKVLRITDDYYTFSGTLDSLPFKKEVQDTVWRKMKPKTISN